MTSSTSSLSRRQVVKAVLACIAPFALLQSPRPADAIPAFARKYQTSCQTCHVAFPKLNPFGEAFRLRGYRMPAETEDLIKESPVALGAQAYKSGPRTCRAHSRSRSISP